MTRVLKLVKGSTTLNLLNATDGITLRAGGDNWQPQYPVVTVNGDPDPVVETMRLQCRGASQNAIAGTMQIWADMMRGASIYRTDANGTAPVWLHAKLDDETNERRSIVHRIDAAWVDSGMTETIDQDVLLFDAAIERGPYWEDTTPVAMGTASIYTNLLTNGDFSTAGAGGADVIASWDETAGDGTIALTSGQAVLTAGATANTKISQTVTLAPYKQYVLTFDTKVASGDAAGRIGVYNVTRSVAVIPIRSTGITSTDTRDVTLSFYLYTTVGDKEVRIDLWCPPTNTDIVYYDNVRLYQLDDAPCAKIGYTAVAGDIPARLAPLTINQPVTALQPVAAKYETMWVGFRSDTLHSAGTAFSPISKFLRTDAETDAAAIDDIEASCYGWSGGNAIRVTPGTSAWAKRVSTRMPDGIDDFGDFLWLLRTRASEGEYEVKLRWSISDTQYVEGPTVSVANTNYMWKEMGIASLPPFSPRTFDAATFPAYADARTGNLDIYARRTAGTGVLDLDCIGRVPVDEGSIGLSGIQIQSILISSEGNWNVLVAESPIGDWQSLSLNDAFSVEQQPVTAVSMPGVPLGNGNLYVFANGTASSALAPLVEIYSANTASVPHSQYYRRWLSLRGAE